MMGEGLNLLLLVLKMEEGPTSQGTQWTPRNWKRVRNRFSSSASSKEDSPDDPRFYPSEICVRLRTYR